MTKTAKKTISFLTVLCFVVTQNLFAAPGMGIEIMSRREVPSFLQVDIPSELATLDGLYEAPLRPDPKLILHIQNAHANYGAQQKIKELLEYLEKNYAMKTIFVEGASEDLNPAYLKMFPDKERNVKLAEFLAKQGELTGAELYLLETDGKKIEGKGIEDAALYRENYEALKKVFGSEVTVKHYLEGFEGRLSTLSSKVFSKDLLKLLGEWKKFEKGHREFMPYVKSLAGEAKRVLGVDLESLLSQVEWPQITRLLVLQQMEKELDTQKGLAEREQLIAFLKEKRVSEKLITAIGNFQDQRVTILRGNSEGGAAPVQPRDLMEQLAREAGPKGFYFYNYPNFSLYAGYLILKSEMDPKGLFNEVKALFTRILDQLAQTAREKQLLELCRNEELVRKLLNLELTRKDWQEARERQGLLSMDAMVSGLKEIGTAVSLEFNVPLTNFETKPVSPKFRKEVTEIQEAAYGFYEAARKREEVFYEKIEAVMQKESLSKAVLITGGFHTDGITELLREHEVSYGILTPRLSEKSDENLYRNVMLQNKQSLFELSYLEAASRLISADAIAAQVGEDQLLKHLKPLLSAIGFAADSASVSEAIKIFNAQKTGVFIDPQPLRVDHEGKAFYKATHAKTGALTAGLTAGVKVAGMGNAEPMPVLLTPEIVDRTLSDMAGTAEPVRGNPGVSATAASLAQRFTMTASPEARSPGNAGHQARTAKDRAAKDLAQYAREMNPVPAATTKAGKKRSEVRKKNAQPGAEEHRKVPDSFLSELPVLEPLGVLVFTIARIATQLNLEKKEDVHGGFVYRASPASDRMWIFSYRDKIAIVNLSNPNRNLVLASKIDFSYSGSDRFDAGNGLLAVQRQGNLTLYDLGAGEIVPITMDRMSRDGTPLAAAEGATRTVFSGVSAFRFPPGRQKTVEVKFSASGAWSPIQVDAGEQTEAAPGDKSRSEVRGRLGAAYTSVKRSVVRWRTGGEGLGSFKEDILGFSGKLSMADGVAYVKAMEKAASAESLRSVEESFVEITNKLNNYPPAVRLQGLYLWGRLKENANWHTYFLDQVEETWKAAGHPEIKGYIGSDLLAVLQAVGFENFAGFLDQFSICDKVFGNTSELILILTAWDVPLHRDYQGVFKALQESLTAWKKAGGKLNELRSVLGRLREPLLMDYQGVLKALGEIPIENGNAPVLNKMLAILSEPLKTDYQDVLTRVRDFLIVWRSVNRGPSDLIDLLEALREPLQQDPARILDILKKVLPAWTAAGGSLPVLQGILKSMDGTWQRDPEGFGDALPSLLLAWKAFAGRGVWLAGLGLEEVLSLLSAPLQKEGKEVFGVLEGFFQKYGGVEEASREELLKLLGYLSRPLEQNYRKVLETLPMFLVTWEKIPGKNTEEMHKVLEALQGCWTAGQDFQNVLEALGDLIKTCMANREELSRLPDILSALQVPMQKNAPAVIRDLSAFLEAQKAAGHDIHELATVLGASKALLEQNYQAVFADLPGFLEAWKSAGRSYSELKNVFKALEGPLKDDHQTVFKKLIALVTSRSEFGYSRVNCVNALIALSVPLQQNYQEVFNYLPGFLDAWEAANGNRSYLNPSYLNMMLEALEGPLEQNYQEVLEGLSGLFKGWENAGGAMSDLADILRYQKKVIDGQTYQEVFRVLMDLFMRYQSVQGAKSGDLRLILSCLEEFMEQDYQGVIKALSSLITTCVAAGVDSESFASIVGEFRGALVKQSSYPIALKTLGDFLTSWKAAGGEPRDLLVTLFKAESLQEPLQRDYGGFVTALPGLWAAWKKKGFGAQELAEILGALEEPLRTDYQDVFKDVPDFFEAWKAAGGDSQTLKQILKNRQKEVFRDGHKKVFSVLPGLFKEYRRIKEGAAVALEDNYLTFEIFLLLTLGQGKETATIDGKELGAADFFGYVFGNKKFLIPGYWANFYRFYVTETDYQKAFSSGYQFDPAAADRWSYESAKRMSMDEMWDQSQGGSGHVFFHGIHKDSDGGFVLEEAILRTGYLIPRENLEAINDQNTLTQAISEKRISPLMASGYLHGSVDHIYLDESVTIAYPLEVILENQAYFKDPLIDGEDFPIRGFSKDVEHESHRVPSGAGTILVPLARKEKFEALLARLEATVEGWQRPNKIFYYRGDKPSEGRQELIEHYHLKYQDPILSRKPEIVDEVKNPWTETPIRLMAIKMDHFNGLPKYKALPYLSRYDAPSDNPEVPGERLTSVLDFSGQLTRLVGQAISAEGLSLEDPATFPVQDTGSAVRGTYNERFRGLPDDFDLMVYLKGSRPSPETIEKVTDHFVQGLKDSGALAKALGTDVAYTLQKNVRPGAKEGSVLATVKVFKGSEQNVPILSIDVNTYADAENNDGPPYQKMFMEQMKDLLSNIVSPEEKAEGRQFLLSTMRTLKMHFKDEGVYKRWEGGLRGVGVEQLVMQLRNRKESGFSPTPAASLKELKEIYSVPGVYQWIEEVGFQGGLYRDAGSAARQLDLTDPGATSHNLATGMSEAAYQKILALAVDVGDDFRKAAIENGPERARSEIREAEKAVAGVPSEIRARSEARMTAEDHARYSQAAAKEVLAQQKEHNDSVALAAVLPEYGVSRVNSIEVFGDPDKGVAPMDISTLTTPSRKVNPMGLKVIEQQSVAVNGHPVGLMREGKKDVFFFLPAVESPIEKAVREAVARAQNVSDEYVYRNVSLTSRVFMQRAAILEKVGTEVTVPVGRRLFLDVKASKELLQWYQTSRPGSNIPLFASTENSNPSSFIDQNIAAVQIMRGEIYSDGKKFCINPLSKFRSEAREEDRKGTADRGTQGTLAKDEFIPVVAAYLKDFRKAAIENGPERARSEIREAEKAVAGVPSEIRARSEARMTAEDHARYSQAAAKEVLAQQKEHNDSVALAAVLPEYGVSRVNSIEVFGDPDKGVAPMDISTLTTPSRKVNPMGLKVIEQQSVAVNGHPVGLMREGKKDVFFFLPAVESPIEKAVREAVARAQNVSDEYVYRNVSLTSRVFMQRAAILEKVGTEVTVPVGRRLFLDVKASKELLQWYQTSRPGSNIPLFASTENSNPSSFIDQNIAAVQIMRGEIYSDGKKFCINPLSKFRSEAREEDRKGTADRGTQGTLAKDEFIPVVAAYLKDFRNHPENGEAEARGILDLLEAAKVDARFYVLFLEPYMANWSRSFANFYMQLKNPEEMSPVELRSEFIRFLGKATIFRADAVPVAQVDSFSERVKTRGLQSNFRAMRIDPSEAGEKETALFRKYGLRELVRTSMGRVPLAGLENGAEGRKAFFLSVSVVDEKDPDRQHAEQKAEAYAREVAAAFSRVYILDANRPFWDEVPRAFVYKDSGTQKTPNDLFKEHAIVVHKAVVDRFYLVPQAGTDLDTEVIHKRQFGRKGVRVQTGDDRFEYVDMDNDVSLENMLTEIPAESLVERRTYSLNAGIGHVVDIEEKTALVHFRADDFWSFFRDVYRTFGIDSQAAKSAAQDFIMNQMEGKVIPAQGHFVETIDMWHVARTDRDPNDPDAAKKEAIYKVIESLERHRTRDMDKVSGIDWTKNRVLPGFDKLEPEKTPIEPEKQLSSEYHKARFEPFTRVQPKDERPFLAEIGWGLFHEMPQGGYGAPNLGELQEMIKKMAKNRFGWLTQENLTEIAAMIKAPERGRDEATRWDLEFTATGELLAALGLTNGSMVKSMRFDENTREVSYGQFKVVKITNGQWPMIDWEYVSGDKNAKRSYEPRQVIEALNGGDMVVLGGSRSEMRRIAGEQRPLNVSARSDVRGSSQEDQKARIGALISKVRDAEQAALAAGKPLTEQDLRQRGISRNVKDLPVLAYVIPESGEIPEDLRLLTGGIHAQPYSKEYIRENAGGVLIFQAGVSQGADPVPLADFYIPPNGKINFFNAHDPVGGLEKIEEKNPKLFGQLKTMRKEAGDSPVNVLDMVKDLPLQSFRKKAVVTMYRMSDLGYPRDQSVMIQTRWGEQPKPAGEGGWLAIDADGFSYIINEDVATGNPIGNVLAPELGSFPGVENFPGIREFLAGPGVKEGTAGRSEVRVQTGRDDSSRKKQNAANEIQRSESRKTVTPAPAAWLDADKFAKELEAKGFSKEVIENAKIVLSATHTGDLRGELGMRIKAGDPSVIVAGIVRGILELQGPEAAERLYLLSVAIGAKATRTLVSAFEEKFPGHMLPVGDPKSLVVDILEGLPTERKLQAIEAILALNKNQHYGLIVLAKPDAALHKLIQAMEPDIRARVHIVHIADVSGKNLSQVLPNAARRMFSRVQFKAFGKEAFVITGTAEMCDHLGEGLTAAIVERAGDIDAAVLDTAGTAVAAAFSQELLMQGETLSERTRQGIQKNGLRYQFNPGGLQKLLLALTAEIAGLQSLQQAA